MNDPFSKSAKDLGGTPTITPQDVKEFGAQCQIVDVRRPDEYTGELGHIAGTKLVTLETDLEKYVKTATKDPTYVFVCRSGGRSGEATRMAKAAGLRAYNMQGGMLAWNELGFKTEK